MTRRSLLLSTLSAATLSDIAKAQEHAKAAKVSNTAFAYLSVADAREIAAQSGATIEILIDPREAVCGADAVYTDAWVSMGHEHETAEREKIFPPYQVNEALVAEAVPHAVFMHCMPAHRGLEITDGVMDSIRSVVFDQAESRLHVQKAILLLLLGGGVSRVSRNGHV